MKTPCSTSVVCVGYREYACSHRSTKQLGGGVILRMMAAAAIMHLAAAALHPTLTLLAGVAWAVAAAAASRGRLHPQQTAWLTLFAALQLRNAADGSFALTAWHRLPWAHRPWADLPEAAASAGSAFAAMVLCVSVVGAGSGGALNSLQQWLNAQLSGLGGTVVLVAAVVVPMINLGAQLGLSVHDGFMGLGLAPNVAMNAVLGVLFVCSSSRVAEAPERTRAD